MAVCPLDKGEPNRTVERNFCPVSVLNTFLKIYEKVLTQQLTQHLDKTLSVFIAAFRQKYGTQRLIIFNETKRTKRTKRAKRTKQTKRIFDQIKNNHRIHLKRVVSRRLDIPKANCNKSKEWECS